MNARAPPAAAGMMRSHFTSGVLPKWILPTSESTTGGFCRSSSRTYARSCVGSSCARRRTAGSRACGRPAAQSVTTSGTPCAAMLAGQIEQRARCRRRRSCRLSARNTRAYMRLERCASRAARARRAACRRRTTTSSTTSRMPTISSGAPRRIALADPVGPYIRPQHLGDGHACRRAAGSARGCRRCVRGNASPEPFSVCTKRGFSPFAGR